MRVLLILAAETKREIHTRLAGDPWAESDRLVISSLEPWHVLVGAERLAAVEGTVKD